jgi:hypothetical protein
VKDEAEDGLDLVARESLRAWAKTVLGAPRKLDEMVYLLKQEEEDFVRVATEIHRRELLEQRAPAPPDASRRPPAVFMDLRTLDPWAIGEEELRTASQRVDTCAGCQGTGANACPSCGGSGQVTCSTCAGVGRAHASGAPCALCGGQGSVGCHACSARGMIACSGCAGVGLQGVWMTYNHTARLDVRLVPQSALSALYPQLAELRILSVDDLSPFLVRAAQLTDGPVGPGMLAIEEEERLSKHGPAIDARLERVSQQQYVRFGAVRREYAFEMVGTRGRVVLAGARCAVEAGPETFRPIRIRLAAWLASTAIFALGMAIFYLVVRGPVPYARGANFLLIVLLLIATIAGSATLGAILRILGLRMRRQRLFFGERLYPALFAGAMALVFVVKALSRPTAVEARAAIEAKNAARAAVVIEALDATGADADEVGKLHEELDFLEAQALTGDARLARLDELASQGGVRAADAARLARDERIARVRAMIREQKFTQALELSDQLFLGADKEAPEVLEVRALVYDTEYAQCSADPCRYMAARKAEKANPTPDRKQRSRDLRVKLASSLDLVDRVGETTLERLVRARQLDATAKAVAPAAGGDTELEEKVKAAQRWAEAARGAVPLLGSARPVIEELIGTLEDSGGKLRVVIQGVAAYVVFDSKRDVCVGLYVVGESKDTRQQGLKTELLPSLLLAKAVGHPAKIKEPPEHAPTAPGPAPTETSWKEGPVPIVVRWRNGVFVELRVGDASPSPPTTARPPPPGKAKAYRITAFPGGQIVLDGAAIGKDGASVRLRPGKHEIKVRNRFLGDNVHPIDVKDGDEEAVIVW